jgi:hypothetical protein
MSKSKSAPKIETLHFNILGDWVTDTARSWLYEEKRPYEKVLDFLLSSMEGSTLSREELRKFANDILVGKKRLTGSTIDNTYGMMDDDTDIIGKYSDYFSNKIPEQETEEEERIAESRERINRLFKSVNSMSPVKNSEGSKDYGWLNPNGKFYPVPWGEHTKWAYEYVEKHYPKADYMDEADFLISRRWILIHSPANSIPIIEMNSATKRQKEFLYDYYMERGMMDDANSVWK